MYIYEYEKCKYNVNENNKTLLLQTILILFYGILRADNHVKRTWDNDQLTENLGKPPENLCPFVIFFRPNDKKMGLGHKAETRKAEFQTDYLWDTNFPSD